MLLDSAGRESDKNWGGGGEVEPKRMGSRTLTFAFIIINNNFNIYIRKLVTITLLKRVKQADKREDSSRRRTLSIREAEK